MTLNKTYEKKIPSTKNLMRDKMNTKYIEFKKKHEEEMEANTRNAFIRLTFIFSLVLIGLILLNIYLLVKYNRINDEHLKMTYDVCNNISRVI